MSPTKPHHVYTARDGRVYDETGAEAGTARSADGRDLERHDAALQVARRQREELEAAAARELADAAEETIGADAGAELERRAEAELDTARGIVAAELERKREQRRLLARGIRRLAELEPRAYVDAYPDRYDLETHRRRDGYPLEELAPMTIIPTDAAHVHVSTPSGERYELVSRGRTYSVSPSQHAYRHPDGVWRLEHPDPVQNEPRNGAGRLYGCDEAPPTAREQMRGRILEAVQKWTSEHPEELEHADRAALNNAAGRREGTIARLAGELAEQLEQLEQIDAGGPDAPRY